MEERKRTIKKVFITVAYFAIFLGLGAGVYFLIRPAPAPVAPPGPEISSLEIIWSQAFKTGPSTYSLGAKIRNPNTNFGARSFNYTFRLYDSNGNLLNTVSGNSFIWPGESKYVVEGGVESAKTPSETLVTIENLNWQELTGFKGVDLTVGNISYGKGKAGSGKSFTVDFTVSNGTSYDLDKIFVSAIVYGKFSQPVGVGSTIFENLKSKERRQFSIPWFSDFTETPSRVELGVTANIWDRPELLGE